MSQVTRDLLSSSAPPPPPPERNDEPSDEQKTPPPRPRGRPRRDIASSISPPAIHRRQDRGGDDVDDDAAAAQRLPIYVRFADLVDANIVRNWPTLLRLINTQDFPCGIMIGRNVRAWPLDQVMAWLATRPTAKKVAHRRKQQRDEIAEASA